MALPSRRRLAEIAKTTVNCLDETEPFVGNCSAIDPVTDKATDEFIHKELTDGNTWAWCTVEVVVEWSGHTACATLGACSYQSERDFRATGPFDDLRGEALDELHASLASAVRRNGATAGVARSRADTSAPCGASMTIDTNDPLCGFSPDQIIVGPGGQTLAQAAAAEQANPTNYGLSDGYGNQLAIGIQPHLARRIAQERANEIGGPVWLWATPAREGDEGERFDPAPEPPRYERIAESKVPDNVRFDVPRRFQGQGTAGEVAFGGFGRSEHDHGDPYKRVRTAVEVGRSRGGTYYKRVK